MKSSTPGHIVRKLFLLPFLVLQTTAISAPAADLLAPLQRAYNAADYEVAVKLGREAIKLQPKNVVAHYYMANSLAKLGRQAEAVSEYRNCHLLSPNSEIGINSAKAIQSLTKRDQGRQTSVATKPKSLTQTLDQQLKGKLESLKDSSERDRKLASDRYDTEVKSIQQNSNMSNEEFKTRTASAFRKHQSELAKIDDQYQRLADDLMKRNASIDRSSKDAASSNRVVSHGSNMYVQNFENLSDEEGLQIPTENPMTATAQKLVVPAAKHKQPAGKKRGAK